MLNSKTKKLLFSLLGLVALVVGIAAGVWVVRQPEPQLIEKEASVPEGEATVSLSPTEGTFNIGETIPVEVYFNTANIAISAIAVRLTYGYSGDTPELVASTPVINPDLLSSGDWSCPIKAVTAESGVVNVDVACANVNIAGFAASADTLLASFSLAVEQFPAANPVVLSFDPNQSIITRKSDGADILLIPQSSGAYTIAGGEAPTPTSTPAAPAPTPTPTSQPQPTATLTPTATATPTSVQGAPAEPTATPIPTSAPHPTVTPTPAHTQTPQPTVTSTPTPTSTPQAAGSVPETAVGGPETLPETASFASTLALATFIPLLIFLGLRLL